MRPVDEKIVRMSLDIGKFKSNASEATRTFAGMNRDINSAANGVNISKIAEGMAAVERRFSVGGVAVATIVSNLTTSAMNLGKSLMDSMINPLVEGGKKRALNIEQAKFQFKGLKMDVDATMESAMAAVSGTAFGLDEAAMAAAQFGASGMRAGDEMTAALRGISGVAAMTGSSYTDIANVFTSVAGNGRLMGNDLLRLSTRGVNAAATLADAMGITEQEVRKMVTAGEISFEQFATAMDDAFGEHATKANDTYAGSLANLKAAFARIGAAFATQDFENKRRVFNELNRIVNAFHTAIVPVIEAWNQFTNTKTEAFVKSLEKINFDKFVKLGGVTDIVESLWNVLETGQTILKAVGEGFAQIFPPLTTETFINITRAIKSLTERLTISGKGAEKLKTVFAGIFSVFSTVWEVAKILGGVIRDIIPPMNGGGFVDFIVKLAEMAIHFNESVKSGYTLKVVTATITAVVQDLTKRLEEFKKTSAGAFIFEGVDKIKELFAWMAKQDWKTIGLSAIEKGSTIVNGLADAFKKVADTLSRFKDAFRSAFEVPDDSEGLNKTAKAMDFIGSVFSGLWKIIGVVIDPLKEFIKTLSMKDLLTAGGIGALVVLVRQFGKVGDHLNTFLGQPTVLVDRLVISMSKFTRVFNNAFGDATWSLIRIAAAVTLFAISMRLLQGVSWENIGKGFIVMAGGIFMLTTAMSKMATIPMTFLDAVEIGIVLGALTVAVGLLTIAMKSLGKMDPKQLGTGMTALTTIMTVLAVGLGVLTKAVGHASAGEIAKVVVSLQTIGGVMLIMAASMRLLGGLDPESLSAAIEAMSFIMLSLAGSLAILAKIKMPSFSDMIKFVAFTIGLSKAAVALVIFSGAVHILISAVDKLGAIDVQTLEVGLISLALLLAQIAIFQKVAGNNGSLKAGVGLAVVAGAIMLLLVPLKEMGTMDMGVLTQGLVAMGIALAGLAVSITLAKSGLAGAAGILVAVYAINELLPVLQSFGNMSADQISASLIMLGGALAILTISMVAMSKLAGGAVALVVVAGAISVLAIPLKSLGEMSLGQIVLALVALGGALAIIGGAAVILSPVVPIIILLAGAVALLGGGVLLAGAGLLLFSSGLVAFGGSVAVAVTGLIGAIAVFVDGIGELAPKIINAITNVILALCEAIIRSTPAVVFAAVVLIASLLQGLVSLLPLVIDTGIFVVLALIDGLAKAVPALTLAAIGLLIEFVVGMKVALQTKGPELIGAVLGLVGEIFILVVQGLIAALDALIGWFPGVSSALEGFSKDAGDILREQFDGETLGLEAAGGVVDGYDKGLAEGPDLVEERMDAINDSSRLGLNRLNTEEIGQNKIGELGDGMMSMLPGIGDTSFDISSVIGEGTTSFDMFGGGEDMMSGLDEGLMSMMPDLEGTGFDIAEMTEGSMFSFDAFGGGKEKVEETGDGMDAGKAYAIGKAEGVSDDILKKMGLYDEKFEEDGKTKTKKVAKGMESERPAVRAAAQEIREDGKKNLYLNTTPTGENYGSGVVRGMNNKKGSVAAAARRLAEGALSSMRRTFQEASPSKAAARSGENLGLGLVQGIKGKMGLASDTAGMLAKRSMDSMNSFLGEFTKEFEKNNEMEVTVKPVVDLDSLTKIPDQAYGLKPDLSRTNLRVDSVAATFRQNGNKSLENDPKKVEIHETRDLNIKVEGADGLMDDIQFVDKLKSVMLNEISTGNRTIPNRTSLIPI